MLPSDACEALGNFRYKDGLREGFYTTLDGGLDAMLCWGPSCECTLYWDNTWPLEVVAWWFWKSSGCARSWLVRMGAERLPSSVLANEFGSVGTNTDYDSYWGTPLGLRIVAVTKLFPHVDYRWWLVVGGASRHSWQEGLINVIIKECRIRRHPEEDVNVWVWGLGCIKSVRGLNCYWNVPRNVFFILSSPYLCVWRWSCNSLHRSRC